MKKLKNKNIILGLIAIMMVMSVGFVVNSYYVDKGNKSNYSEALDREFTSDGRVIYTSKENKDDAIKTDYKYYTGSTPDENAEILTHDLKLKPWKQFWDGLSATEKKGRVLIVPKYKKDANGKPIYNQYEDLVIHKKDKDGKHLKGIKFCIAESLTKSEVEGKTEDEIKQKLTCNTSYEKIYKNWVTKDNGELKIPTNELPLYNQTIIETPDMKDTYNQIKLDIYVDPGNRFLGEVKGKDFITYADLLKEIKDDGKHKIGSDLGLGNDTGKAKMGTDTGGNWLKIYDAREGKILYISKKPLTNYVSWQDLYKAGVVYGPDQVLDESGKLKTEIEFNIDEYIKDSSSKTGNKLPPYKPKTVNFNGKTYLIRLLKGTSRPDPNNTGITYRDYYSEEDLTKSEWNRYILPLTKHYRYGYWSSDDTDNGTKRYTRYVGEELTKDKDGNRYAIPNSDETVNKENAYTSPKGWKIELSTYNWFGDLTLGAYQTFWYDGENSDTTGIYSKGQYSWMQESLSGGERRAFRGSGSLDYGAAGTNTLCPGSLYYYYGFRPVLEEIPNS